MKSAIRVAQELHLLTDAKRSPQLITKAKACGKTLSSVNAALQVHHEAFAANLHGRPRLIEARPLPARREGGSQ